MYEYQNRGTVERYYNKQHIDNVHGASDEYRIYRQKWDDPKQKIHIYPAPLEILVELTSWCNYTCKMCLKNFVVNTERVNMPLDLVKKIANEAREMNVNSLWIGASSECLIHPNIKEALNILLSVPTIDSTLLTNGSCLTKDIACILVDKQVKNVSVSLDAVYPKTYENIRGGNLLHVEENIERLLRIRGDKDFPLLRVSMVKMPENKDQRERFLNKWEGKADIIDFQTLVVYDKTKKIKKKKEYMGCMDPFKRLHINYDGAIYPCCVSGYQEAHYLGNIKDITLMEAWNSPKLQQLREELRSGNLSENCLRCCESLV